MTQTTGNETTKTSKRIFVLGLFVSGLAAFVYFDLGAYLSYAALAENEEFLRRTVAARHLPAAAAYVGIYILAVALSLPGAIWLTLSGGLLFGVWLGGALAVLGAGTGAAAGHSLHTRERLLRDGTERVPEDHNFGWELPTPHRAAPALAIRDGSGYPRAG